MKMEKILLWNAIISTIVFGLMGIYLLVAVYPKYNLDEGDEKGPIVFPIVTMNFSSIDDDDALVYIKDSDDALYSITVGETGIPFRDFKDHFSNLGITRLVEMHNIVGMPLNETQKEVLNSLVINY